MAGSWSSLLRLPEGSSHSIRSDGWDCCGSWHTETLWLLSLGHGFSSFLFLEAHTIDLESLFSVVGCFHVVFIQGTTHYTKTWSLQTGGGRDPGS